MRYLLKIEAREPNPLYVPLPALNQLNWNVDDRPPQHREQFQEVRVCEVELTEAEYQRVRHAIIGGFTVDTELVLTEGE